MGSQDIDFTLVKPAHSKSLYTPHQLREIAKCAADPLYFMEKYMWIQHPTKGKIPFDAYEFQKRLVECYWKNVNTIALLPRQAGKALALDTPVPTPSGWTTMGDIKVGDMIISADGKPTIVTFATEVMDDHTCYEIEFDNGEKITADAEHLWRVTSSNWPLKTKLYNTQEIVNYLSNGTKNRRMWIDIAAPIELPEIDLPIAPYTLGVWLGDGASAGGCYTQSNIDNLEVIKYIEQDGFMLSPPRVNSPNSETRTIYGLMPILRKENLLKNKHIPSIYLRSSIRQRLELLKGLMDTDGYVNIGGHCEFYQKDLMLINQVRELLSSLGIKSRLKFNKYKGQIYHKLVFTTIKHDVFKLKRKLQRQRRCMNHPKNNRLYIQSIRPHQSVPVRCIQVSDPTHMFLCGRTMIPTHNTTTAAGFLLWYAMFEENVTVLIAANKFRAATEIMDRIKFAYEELPDWLRAGVATYNVQDIKFDNGSRIKATTTTPDSGRGMSVSLLYCLDGDTTTVRIRNKSTHVEEDITLADLYRRLSPANIKILT